MLLGACIGTVIGPLLTYGGRIASSRSESIVDVVRGTPVLVLILASYYMPAGLGLSPGPIEAGIVALTVFCASHVGETLRGALIAIPPTQIDAARSIGLTFPKMLFFVLLPQAIRQIAPNFVNTAVEIVKASSLLSAIGVGELLLTTQEIVGRTFMTMEFYALAGALYLAINLTIGAGGWWVERRFRRVREFMDADPHHHGLTKSFGAQHDPPRRRFRGLPGAMWWRSSGRAARARRRCCAASTCLRNSRPARSASTARSSGYRSRRRAAHAALRPAARQCSARRSPWCSRATTSSRI